MLSCFIISSIARLPLFICIFWYCDVTPLLSMYPIFCWLVCFIPMISMLLHNLPQLISYSWWYGIYLGQRIKGIIDSCAWMCLCYFMQWIDKIVKYIDTEVVSGNIIGKHVNMISLIRSSPNALGLCLLVQPSVVASILCFQSRFFTIVSSIWVSLNRYRSVGLDLNSPRLWITQTLLTELSTSIGHSSMSPIWDSNMTGKYRGFRLNLSIPLWSTQNLFDSLWLYLAWCYLQVSSVSSLCSLRLAFCLDYLTAFFVSID